MKTSTRFIADTGAQEKLFPLTRFKRQVLITIALIVLDVTTIGIAFRIAYQLRFFIFQYNASFDIAHYQQMVILVLPIWIMILAAFKLYSPNILFGGMQEYSAIFNAVTLGVGAIVLVDFAQRGSIELSRGWIVISWFLVLILLLLVRFSFRRGVYAIRKRGHLLSAAVLVGANNEGRVIAEQLRDSISSGLYISGFVDNDLPFGSPVVNGYKVIGDLDDLDRLIKRENIEEIIISPTALNRDQLLGLYQKFTPNPNVTLRLSSGLFEVLNTGLRVKELAFVPLIEVNQGRIIGFDAFMKLLMDFSLSLVGLIILSPVLLLTALAIRIDSRGPIIYRRRVMGANGSQFDAFKFRTMAVNGDEILNAQPELRRQLDENFKLKEDPRVTRVGAFIRKYSLDELPQLLNVLLGQMSCVGPRMISPPEMSEYKEWGMNLLTVKPGITGLWQVSGRSDISYEERVSLDMYYIRNWTIWMDIFLLLSTIPAVIRKKGAY